MRSVGVFPRLAATLLLLASGTEAQELLFEVSGNAAAAFGRSVDLVGDTNGDGFGEFLVGASSAANGALREAGRVQLYSGLDGSLLATFLGTGAGDHLGFGSGAAGDANGDGFADLCLAAHADDVPGVGVDAGSVQVVSGRDGSLLHTFTGAGPHTHLGRATRPAGDVNGDGRDDLLVSSGFGLLLLLYSGRDGSVLGQFSVGSNYFAIAPVGDLDGDGSSDFASLEELPGPGPNGHMLVTVSSGADGSVLWQRGAGLDDASLSVVSDVNGDGRDEVVVGSPFVNSSAGRVRLLSGADGALILEVFGDEPQDRLGASIVGAGDLDGDGYDDLAAGMPGFDGAAGRATGAVRAYSGRTGAVISTLEGERPDEGFGARLGGGRDVNGDGIPEVIAATTAVVLGSPAVAVKVLSFVPHGLVPFGTGSPGCLGSSSLLAGGVPRLGTSFVLHASNLGASPHLVVGDTASPTGSLVQRALFHLDFAPPPPAVGLVFQTPLPGPEANGSLVAPLTIPSTPALMGLTFVFQVASLFPAGPCAQRVATSRALLVTIQ